jgi:8-oxo-dGDP phosphatase
MSPAEQSSGTSASTHAPEADPALGDDERGGFRLIGERARYDGERLRVVVATLVGPDGFTFERELVRTFDAVCIVPLEADGEHVLCVRQYRGAADDTLLELPAGKLDVPGESAEECGKRELAEEAGVEAAKWTELAHFLNSPGFCDETTYCFLAEELVPCERFADGVEEQHLIVERLALNELDELIAAGEIRDAKTLIGLALTRSVLARRAVASPAPSPLA